MKKEKYKLFAKHSIGAFFAELFIKGGYDHLVYLYDRPTLEAYISDTDSKKLALAGFKLYSHDHKVDNLVKKGRELALAIKKIIDRHESDLRSKKNSELTKIFTEILYLTVEIGKVYRFTEEIYTGKVDEKIREYVQKKAKNQNAANYILSSLVDPLENKKSTFVREEIINRLKIPTEIASLCRSVRMIGREKFIFRAAINDLLEYLIFLIHEVAKRNHLAFSQIEACFVREIMDLLSRKKVNIGLINQRAGHFVAFKKGKNYIFYTKERARKIASRIKPEFTKNIRELKGDIASLGVVTGKVKIILDLFSLRDKILLNKKIRDMKKGEILVTTTSGPEMIMACRKAGAIVADEGGINSHAAIISRELRIPGIVNVKMATQILNDGDLVKVDAYSGIISILNKRKGHNNGNREFS